MSKKYPTYDTVIHKLFKLAQYTPYFEIYYKEVKRLNSLVVDDLGRTIHKHTKARTCTPPFYLPKEHHKHPDADLDRVLNPHKYTPEAIAARERARQEKRLKTFYENRRLKYEQANPKPTSPRPVRRQRAKPSANSTEGRKSTPA